MKPLTPEKLDKKQRDNLKMLHARIRNAYSFKQITTWEQLKEYTPIPNDKKGILTYDELKSILQGQLEELEQKIRERQSQRVTNNVSTDVRKSEEISNLPQPENIPSRSATPSTSVPIPEKHIVSQALDDLKHDDESGLNNDNDYGLIKSPNECAFHYWFQKKAIAQALHKITVEKRRGLYIIASTGTGKTFIGAGLVRRLVDSSFHEFRTMSHIPYLYITRASIVEQTERVFRNFYNLTVEDMEVINIEQLRSKAGRLWVKEEMEVIGGEEVWKWCWKERINPCVILWDEGQYLKNQDSTQHKIGAAFNDLKTPETYQVFMSATPFTRVCEAKCFAVSTRHNIEHLGFPKGTYLTNQTWPAYAAVIAAPSSPDEYNEAAVDRLMDDLKDYIIHVKGVRPQFEAKNKIKKITFQTDDERAYYQSAYDRYVKEQNRLLALKVAGAKGAGAGILVEFLKFRMAAEYVRRFHLAKEMWEAVNKRGKAAVCALGFKSTIIAIVKTLVNDYNVPRDQICLIWGGGQTQLTKKQEAKKKIQEMGDKLEAMGMTVEEMLKDLDLDSVEDRIIEELDPSLRLGPQSLEERQIEIDRFQSGKALYCLFTFRAGGVGLSLHHCDELTKVKVKRKPSGYAIEEDIPNIPIRPRETFLSPTYSAIELVQGLGRAPRLTSLSHTEQTLLFYAGTIEDDVAAIVSKKLRCLSRVVRMRESWEDVVIGGVGRTRSEITQRHIDSVPDEDSGGDAGMIDTEEDE